MTEDMQPILQIAANRAAHQAALEGYYYLQNQARIAVHTHNVIRQQMTNAAIYAATLGTQEELPLVAKAVQQIAAAIPDVSMLSEEQAARRGGISLRQSLADFGRGE